MSPKQTANCAVHNCERSLYEQSVNMLRGFLRQIA